MVVQDGGIEEKDAVQTISKNAPTSVIKECLAQLERCRTLGATDTRTFTLVRLRKLQLGRLLTRTLLQTIAGKKQAITQRNSMSWMFDVPPTHREDITNQTKRIRGLHGVLLERYIYSTSLTQRRFPFVIDAGRLLEGDPSLPIRV